MEKGDLIKVGFCVAYDWPMLRNALPLVYESADTICISIDKDHISWGGERFVLDQAAFLAFIAAIDIKKKITVFQDDFHKPELTPMQNEVRQRNLMAQRMGEGGWHIQLDADEYFVCFPAFVTYLKKLTRRQTRKLNVSCALITLFKKTNHGYFYISPVSTAVEFIQIATREPAYEAGRRNGNFNHLTDFTILHQSWARNEKDVIQKLQSWGHKTDFDCAIFFEKWQSLSLLNYKEFRNFHPISPTLWPALTFIEAKDEIELITNPPRLDFPYSKWDLAWKNNRAISRMKGLLRKVTG